MLLHDKLWPIEEAEQNLVSEDTPPAFIDSGIRKSKKRYVKFVKDLIARGFLVLGFEKRADVGVFAVKKQNGKQRRVVDASRSNACFAVPDPVALPTSACFSRLHVPEGRHLHSFPSTF